MHVEHKDDRMEHESSNIHFLIQQQVALLEALEERGLVDRGAQDLLRRLMRREEEIRALRAPATAG